MYCVCLLGLSYLRIFAAKFTKTMNYTKINWDALGVWAELSSFAPADEQDAVQEFHVILHVEPRGELFEGQINRLYAAEAELYANDVLVGAKPVFKRYFLSDSTNQQPLMRHERDCAVSIIQQPPLDGSKVALWVYLHRGSEVYNDGGMLVAEHNGYRHLWKMGLHEHKGDSAWQTECLLINYEEALEQFGATLERNCIRTWFFVRDVDTQYAGMVKARRENFIEQGLTPETHYVASTGIGGLPADTKALVQLGTYAITGFEPEQQRYLYALTHLNRTIEYGVTFERGTLMEYGDRGHIYISGTASIDNKGQVVYVGDIVKQTQRMWENVEALLAEGGMTYNDVMQIIVYLRDMADYDIVSRMFAEKFPEIPYVLTLAPVCRPTWLIEMECVAVDGRKCPKYRNY